MSDSSIPNDTSLDAIIADYLQQSEAGTPMDREALLVAQPELADRLRAFFSDLDRMGSQAAEFRLPDLALPEDFGDYEIRREIGRGGMGVVYQARQISLNRPVALKMILGGWLMDPATVRRFRDEAETAAGLDHPNIVPIYEVGDHRGHPYFSMKLIEGQSLTKCLDPYLAAPNAAVELLIKICRAVQHAHQRGVLHRDLKPGNILVDAAGEPHVTDFGLARRIEEARGQTRSGVVVGTPESMSPEQAAGEKDLTTAVDIYGLGAVLYSLLTGQAPFQAESVYKTLRAVIENEPVPPRRLRREVPSDLEVICLKCLSKEPDKRYSSAEALAEELQRWLRGEPIQARRVGKVERYRMWSRRKPLVATLVKVSTISIFLLVVSAVAFSWQLSRTNSELTGSNDSLAKTATKLTATVTERDKVNRNLEDELWLKAREVYNQQLARVAAIFEGDPKAALDLLYDTDACPIDQRDIAWRYYENAARKHQPGARPGQIVARSSAMSSKRPQSEQRPNEPHLGHRWVLLRAGDESPLLAQNQRQEALLASPLQVVDLLSNEVRTIGSAEVAGKDMSLERTIISGNGETIAWVNRNSPTNKLLAFDVMSGKMHNPGLEIGYDQPRYLVLSPDGRHLFFDNKSEGGGSDANRLIRLVELRTGATLHTFEPRFEPASPPVFSPDSRYVAFWTLEKDKVPATISVFDLETKSFLPAMPDNPPGSHSKWGAESDLLLFSSDSRHLLRFSNQSDVKVGDRWRSFCLFSVYAIGKTPALIAPPLDLGHIRYGTHFSPDGRTLGIALSDGSITLVDTSTWKIRHKLPGVWAGINFVFRKDGRVLYTATEVSLRAWNVETGEGRVIREGDYGQILGVSDRDVLWSIRNSGMNSPYFGYEAYSWNLAPRPTNRTIVTKGQVNTLRFDKDGRSLHWMEQAGNALTTFTFNLQNGETSSVKGALKEFPREALTSSPHIDPRGDEWDFAIEPNSESYDFRSAWLTNKTTQERRPLPIEMQRGTNYLGPTPDGHGLLFAHVSRRNPEGTNLIIYARQTGLVEILDVWTGRVRASLVGHSAPIDRVAWAPNGEALAIHYEDGVVKVWEMRRTPIVGRWPCDRMTFAADGRSAILYDWTRTRDKLLVRSLDTGRLERLLLRPKDQMASMRFCVSNDGRFLFGMGTVDLLTLNLATGEQLLRSLNSPGQPFTFRASAAADGSFVVGFQLEPTREGKQDTHEVRLVRMDLPDQTDLILVRIPREWGFLSDSARLQVTSDSREVILTRLVQTRTLKWTFYDASTGDLLRETSLPSYGLASDHDYTGLHPTGKIALVDDPDRAFRIYDLATSKEKWRLPDPAYSYTTTGFSSCGRWLAAATKRGIVHVWEVETGRSVAIYDLRLFVPAGSQEPTTHELRFDLASKRLAARVGVLGSREQVVVWDFVPGTPSAPTKR